MSSLKKLLSYSQHGEDDLIWKFFDKKQSGLIIEVGAFDGIHISNSYTLEQMGWDAICIEPHPEYFNHLKINRPNAICLNYAIIGEENKKEVTFYTDDVGLYSGIETTDSDVEWRYKKKGVEYKGLNKITASASTLNNVLKENNIVPNSIDIISIDVEGSEIDVLNGLDLNKYKPKMIIIEANDDHHERLLKDYFKDFPEYGYARKVSCNLVYVLGRSKEVKKLKRIKINCIPQTQMHPRGGNYTVKIEESFFRTSFNNKINKLKKLLLRIK